MATKKPDSDIKQNEDGSRTGLYADSKKKLITPINVTQKDETDSDGKPDIAPLKSPAEKKTVKLKVKQAADTEEEETDQAAPAVQPAKPDTKTPLPSDKPKVDQESALTTAEEDPQANTLKPEKTAAQPPEFIDEGQYHISVPKAGSKSRSSSLLKKLLIFILIIMLLALAAYLYMDFFGIDLDYQAVFERLKEMIGLD